MIRTPEQLVFSHHKIMASSQNTAYTYPCPLWGHSFDDIVKTGVDPDTSEEYRFINRSSFELLSPLAFQMFPKALLIRDTYEELYNLLSERSLQTKSGWGFSGFAVIGQPGIGQLQLHCVVGVLSYSDVQASRCF